MEDQQINTQQAEETQSIRFIDDAEVQQAQEQTQQEVFEQPLEQTQPDFSTEEPEQQQTNSTYSEEDLNGAVFNFLSERLGRDVNSFDDLQQQQQREIDERVLAIAEFVETTGRNPQDWFFYQSLNPSEMDDATAIQVQMLSDYPNLSQEEVSLLVSSKYKLDPDLHTEDEVRLSQLQLKIDAEASRKAISEIRDRYSAPEVQDQSYDSPINDEWISQMSSNLDDLDAIEFDLGNGNSFNFGLRDSYKRELANKNTRLDEYFDPYVQKDGSWDFDKLNMHQSVIDNIDDIVQSVYRQGMSDGQRGLVNNAANVRASTPSQGSTQNGNPLADQLRDILGIK